jgi:hypothetical protein
MRWSWIDSSRKREALTISRPGPAMAPLRRCTAGPGQKSRKQPHAKIGSSPARSTRAALRPGRGRKMLRHHGGNYPVLRGTFVDLKGKGLLYTRGSVPYYGTYPGLRVPRPWLLAPHENSDGALPKLAEEVPALTKVNWNTTQSTRSFRRPSRRPAKSGAFSGTLNTGCRPDT